MFSISKDTPAYYITSVTNKRLPVFQKAKMKDLVCRALNEARNSAGLLLFAYVIMPTIFISSWERSASLRNAYGM
jgi:hypothetical protein